MARFRHNEYRVAAERIFAGDGLQIERVRRDSQLARLPELDRWRSWSFHIALSGTHYCTYQDRTYTLAPNTILWHSPLRELTRTRRLPGTGSDAVVLRFSAQGWAGFCGRPGGFDEQNHRLLERAATGPLLSLAVSPPQLLHALRQLVVLSSLPGVAELARDTVHLLLLLLGEIRFGAEREWPSPERQQRVEQAQGRMVAQLARPPSLAQLAAELSVSPRQLQRDFRECTGLNPISYLNLVRMSEASHLLAETSIPIAEIAALFGFANQAHFSAAFRKTYQRSPREVRQLCQNDQRG